MIIEKSVAIQKLKEGENVAIPTETVYGLAGRYDSKKAVHNIFDLKKRPSFDPLICHISSVEMLPLVFKNIPDLIFRLAHDFWPGPLTIVAEKSSAVMDSITAGKKTVAVRMPQHKTALEIIAAVGSPLCAPSANQFGKTSPSLAQHVEEEFQGEVAVVDGGPCQIGIESTIIQIHDGSIEILRPGSITKEKLQERGYELTEAPVKLSLTPGMLENHYMPKVPFYLTRADKLSEIENWQNLSEWKLEDNAPEAAQNLYRNLRDWADKTNGFYTIYDASKSEEWTAIWDRLKKASYRKDCFQ